MRGGASANATDATVAMTATETPTAMATRAAPGANSQDDSATGKAFSAQEDTIKALKAQLHMQEKRIKDATDRGYGADDSSSDMNF